MMKTNIKINHFFSIRLMFIFFALVFVLPASFNSCNDEEFLKEKVYSNPLTDIWYGSREGINQGIAGLHQHVRRYWYFGQELQDQIGIWIAGLGTDAAFHGEDPNSTRWLCDYKSYIVPSGGQQGTVDHHWRYSFELIQKANYVIDGCEKLDPAKWKTETQKAEYIAEARFFRAWAYRNLTSFYGKVPVIDYAIAEAKVDFERDPLEKAYSLMEADLIAGTTDLPVRGKEENTGRLTQGAAWQLLCEVYLAQHKYQQAVTAASKLIDGGVYKLMTERFGGKNSVWGTGDVFWDLHARGNQFLAANTEGLWVMPFVYNTSDDYSNHRGGRCWGPAYHRLQHTPDMPASVDDRPADAKTVGHWNAILGEKRAGGNAWPSDEPGYTGTKNGYLDTLGRGVAWIHPTNLTSYIIWEGNWNNDYRNAKHMIKRDFYYNNRRSSFHGKKIDIAKDYAWWYSSDCPQAVRRNLRDDTCQRIFPFFLKKFEPCYIITNLPTSGNGDTFKDIYVMRLAETYLSRAEAYIGLGDAASLDLAIKDINTVRKRSNAKEVTLAEIGGTKETVLDYLLDERARELYSEECRHFVLRRTGTLISRVQKYANNPARHGVGIAPRNVLWPVPLREIELNIEKQWVQNDGY